MATIKGSRTTICLRLTPISETTTDEGVNDELIGNGPLKDVCLALCAGGILMKALELVKLPNYQSIEPLEFLYECLTSEAARRQTRKVATRIKKSACFYPDERIENTLYAPDRNLNRGLIERQASCDWIRNGEHSVVTGATGSGKTWMASALMNAAIRAGLRAKYYRVDELLLEYAEGASDTTSKTSKKKQLNGYHLLMIDEFGLGGLTVNQCADQLEIKDERTREGGKSVIVTSVFPVDIRASCIGDVSFSDSILDRLIYRAWRLNLEGPSMRSRTECGALEDPYGKKLKP